MHSKRLGRRRFLKEGAAIAGVTAGAIRSASGQGQTPRSEAQPKDTREYGERSRLVNSIRKLDRTGQDTPLQDLMGIITPSALHFVQSRGYDPPEIDPRQHRLLIHGLVDRPLIFSMEDLTRFPSVSRILFLECPGNTGKTALEDGAATVQQTHGKTSCSEWTGVPVSILLREAGVQKGAYWLVAEGAEKGNRAQSVPLEKAMDDALVAYGQNGEPLRPEQGFPIRMLLPGCTGGTNTKWLRRIKVLDQPEMGIWDLQQGNAIRVAPDGKGGRLPLMPPKSVITFPSGGQRLPGRGFYEITGLAWSGRGAIKRVEISTDGGQTWKDAQLQNPILPMAHTRFRFPWNWNGEEAVIQSRCTDDQGETQQSLLELARKRGIQPGSFQSDWLKDSYARLGLNAIQPWKVSREGSVSNAMSKLFLTVSVMLACSAALAQTPIYHLGKSPTEEQIGALDLSVHPSGKGLPPGSGTAKKGAEIYAKKCIQCHGPTGAEGPSLPGSSKLWPYSSARDGYAPPSLAGGKNGLEGIWNSPTATTIWSYIRRAMPPKAEGSLSADEVYSLAAWLLYRRGVIQENDIMDAKTLPNVPMPNRACVPWNFGCTEPAGANSDR